MTENSSMDTFRRAVVAVATSILTGATAGALLARRPLVVRVGSDGRRHIGELR